MKNVFSIVLCTLISSTIVLVGCVQNRDVSQPETPKTDNTIDSIEYNDGEQESGIGNFMIVIKMSEDVANHVIVGWPYSRENGQYNVNDLMSLYPFVPSIDDYKLLNDFGKNVLHLCGESPYRPLINGFYIIDWRWLGINRLGFYSTLADIREHCNQAPLLWSDLTTLSVSVASDEVSPIVIDEFWVLPNECIDKYRGAFGTYNTFLGYNSSIYSGTGLCCDLAYQFYNDPNPAYSSYANYVNICDSMFTIYQQCIIEAIEKDELIKLCYNHE